LGHPLGFLFFSFYDFFLKIFFFLKFIKIYLSH